MDENHSKTNNWIYQNGYSAFKWFLVGFIVILFHFDRLMKPTILGDDVIRIVDARTLPFKQQLFRPFSEHIAPGFELATAAIVRPLFNHLDWIPTAFTIFALASWIIFLGILGGWVRQMTGNSEIARMTVAITGVSSACLEVPWWFSAATYSLSSASVIGVLWMIGVNTDKKESELVKGLKIGLLTALAMSFSALGLMAVVLGSVAILAKSGIHKGSIRLWVRMIAGLIAYIIVCTILGGDLLDAATHKNRSMTNIPMGIAYSVAVPGGVALPLFLGMDAKWVTTHFQWLISIILTLMGIGGVWTSYRWKCFSKSVMQMIMCLILVPYLVIYPTRAGLVTDGRWAQADFLYFWTSRYHIFAIIGFSILLSAIIHKIVTKVPQKKIRDLLGIVIIIAIAMLQKGNTNHWSWMKEQPDQKATMISLMKLQDTARSENIGDTELLQIFPPVQRGWNASVLELRPDAFPLVRLIASRNLENHSNGLSNRNSLSADRIFQKIGLEHWLTLRAGRLLNLNKYSLGAMDQEIETGPEILEKARKDGLNRWNVLEYGGYIELTIRNVTDSETIYMESVEGDGPIELLWTMNKDSWDSRRSGWYETKTIENRPIPNVIGITQADRIGVSKSNHEGTLRIRIKPIRPGLVMFNRLIRAFDQMN
ncbi:MAG: hypothetical protein WCJ40_00100 [Planctomycetota bacterium]